MGRKALDCSVCYYVSPSILGRYIVFVSSVRLSTLARPHGFFKTIGRILIKFCMIDKYIAKSCIKNGVFCLVILDPLSLLNIIESLYFQMVQSIRGSSVFLFENQLNIVVE